MIRVTIESVRSLLAGVHQHLLKATGGAFLSGLLAFAADVFGGRNELVWVLAAIAIGLAGVAFFLLWCGMWGHLRRVRAASPAGTPVRAGTLTGGLAFLRDVSLFGTTTALLMAGTGVGQHFFAKPGEPSLFASIIPELKGIREDMKSLKKETSDDPRKELANLGVQWGTQAFVDALISGDERIVKLFLQGGMDGKTRHRGASAILYALQPAAERRVAMLDLLIANGFDVNATLIDPTIMRNWGDTVPPHFEAPGLPSDYGAWNKTFAGPPLLWMTIRVAYAGQRGEDAEVIARLRKAGASPDLSREFLMAMHKSWGNLKSHRDAVMLLK